jgi:hypothetical protein
MLPAGLFFFVLRKVVGWLGGSSSGICVLLEENE